MSARFLLSFFDSAYLFALASWVGSTLFFSFGVAPVLFGSPGDESRCKLVRALFPGFYTWGAVTGSIALPAYLGVPLSYEEYRGPMVAVQAFTILAGTLIMLYGANSLTPALIAACVAGAEQAPRLERLRRRSVGLNLAVLVLGATLLVAFANRPAPTTRGIVEPSPQERVRAQFERLQRTGPPRPLAPPAAGRGGGAAPR